MIKNDIHVMVHGNFGEQTEAEVYRYDTYVNPEIGKYTLNTFVMEKSFEILEVNEIIKIKYMNKTFELKPNKVHTVKITGEPSEYGIEEDDDFLSNCYETAVFKWRNR